MTLISDALRTRLARLRLSPRWAGPAGSDGGRRGSQAGSGMEFADHRDYHAGSDLRHLDTHAYARLGRLYVKVYSADQALDVAVLVDASPSMNHGNPSKLRVAAELAAALAYVGVRAGDRVKIGAFGDGGQLNWRPAVTSSGNIEALVKGLQLPLPSSGRETDLSAVAAACRSLAPGGLTVVLSDWWTAEPEAAVRAFGRSGRELVAVQVLSPDEEEPGMLAEGWTRLVDSERGESLDLALEASVKDAYLRGLAEWRVRFDEAIKAARGRLLVVRSDRPVSEIVLEDWRKSGLLR